ncbi:MAG: hypothetical protein CO150_03185 [Nitrospirae bacterium CG_4_9_14_3_um_filter_53_35]|nr:MAG: hypothetical protein AUK29_01170 [Nitrospirae bacterium CG2_30_53_67]PIS36834.1 MAG: hypothetical protein COT35_09115 [Nitrospirae bacterium CG08_land_8_20_14_0_20_52_24]PIV85445.1 MAG: hypothetical protein COW52_02225 [Nitrospirae bacterium CG17_big_fil_post_rev_8_21_14_2_50_50_9]PIW84152.1 MAG: hypothetical protein COZ95_11280 [Nitrospirae bacterium CG_4_8_14_3_um_filter_50_41]PIX86132.1 MAG: hypothetical protein COZ32_04870 [Nitrospirae bacterium CG_4_10_14_3_um_filter_53_41]PJA7645
MIFYGVISNVHNKCEKPVKICVKIRIGKAVDKGKEQFAYILITKNTFNFKLLCNYPGFRNEIRPIRVKVLLNPQNL